VNFNLSYRTMQAEWTQIEVQNAITARSSHDLSVVPGCDCDYTMYVFGGEHVARNAIDTKLHALQISESSTTAQWQTVEAKGTPPCSRFGHAQASIGDKVYVFGGRRGINMDEKALNDLHCFDTKTNTWSEVKYNGGSAPSKRSFHRMTSIGSMLYVFGGCDDHHGRCNDLHCFDTSTCDWTALPISADIKGRGGPTFQASADGKGLFVVGGFTGCESGDIHRFDIKSQTWSQLDSTMRPRSVCISSSLSLSPDSPAGQIVIFGGEVDESTLGHEGAGDFANDLVVLDGSTGAEVIVSVSDDKPTARGWGAGAPLGTHCLVLFGGLAGSDASPTRLSDVWRLNFTSQ